MKARKFDYWIVVQGNYGYGWDDERFEDNWKEARQRLREYRENGPGAYRLIQRRELRQQSGAA